MAHDVDECEVLQSFSPLNQTDAEQLQAAMSAGSDVIANQVKSTTIPLYTFQRLLNDEFLDSICMLLCVCSAFISSS